MGPRSESCWGLRNDIFDLCGQHLQKHLGEAPSQASAVSPGAIPLNPSVLPWPSHCIPMATHQCLLQSRASWAHPNIQVQLVGCHLLQTPHTVLSPATPTRKPEEKPLHGCALPSPCRPGCWARSSVGSLPGTCVRAARQQLMGKFRVGASRGERHIKGSLCGRSLSAVLIQG